MSVGRPEPLVIHGWTVFAHPLFLAQIEALVRQVETHKLGDVMGMGTGGVDHRFAPDRAAIGLYPGHASVLANDSLHRDRGGKANAELLATMLVSFHDKARSHVTIGGTPKDGRGPGEVHQGPPAFGFSLVDQRRFQSGFVRDSLELAKFLGALVAKRHPEGSHLVPVGLRLRITLQLAKDAHRAHGQLDPLDRIAGLTAQTGALRSRHLTNVSRPLQQKYVGETRLGEGVRHATADRPSTHNDEPCLRR